MDLVASPLQPYQSCWRKFQLNLTAPNHYPTPGVYYSPADIQSKWQPNNPGGAFTSGETEVGSLCLSDEEPASRPARFQA